MVNIALDAGDIQATLTLDRTPFNQELEQAKADAEDFENGDYRARLGADDTDLTEKVDDARARLDDLDGQAAEARLDADETDLDAKVDDAREKLDDLSGDTARVSVDADTGDFDAKVDDAKTRLDDLDAERAEPTVDADTSDFDVKWEDVQARIDRLKSDVATARIDVDDRDALAKLAEIQAALDALGNEVINPNISDDRLREIDDDLDTYREKMDQAAESTSKLDSASKDAQDSAGGLMNMLVATAPAALDAVLYLGAGFVSTASMAATAAVGIGAFALAAAGDLGSIKTQVDDLVSGFQEMNQATVEPAILGVLPVLEAGLEDIEPLVGATAGALERLETAASDALGDPFWQSFFVFVSGEIGPAIGTFGHLIDGLATTFAGLDEAFAPVVANVEQGLNQLAGDMVNFGVTANSNGGLREFVNWLVGQSTPVGNTLHQIGADFVDLVRDALPIAGVTIDVVHAFADLLGAVERVSPLLVTLGVGAFTAYKTFQLLQPAITAVGAALSDIPKLADLFAGLEDVNASSFIGNIAASLGNLDRSIMTTVADMALLNIAGSEMSELEVATAALAAEWGISAEEVTAWAAAMGASEGELVAFAAELGASEGALGAFDALLAANPIGVVAVALTALTAAFAAFHNQISEAESGVGALGRVFTALGPAMDEGVSLFSTVVDRLFNLKTAAQQTGQAIGSQFVASLEEANTPTQQMISLIQQQITHLSDLDDGLSKSSSAYRDNAAEISYLRGQLPGLQSDLSGASQAQQAMADHASTAGVELSAEQAVLQSVATQAGATAASITALTNAEQVLTGGEVALVGAQQQLQSSLAALSTAIRTNGTNFDGNSTAATNNKVAIGQVATAMDTLFNANIQVGNGVQQSTAQMNQQRDSLNALLAAAGLTSSQIQALDAQFGISSRDVSLLGAEAQQSAGSFENTAGAVAGLNSEMASAAAEAAYLRAQLESFQGTYTAQMVIAVHEVGTSGIGTLPGGGHITSYASGTDYHPGGVALVGEEGPELALLPRGTSVIPAGPTHAMLAGALPSYAAGTPDVSHTLGTARFQLVDNVSLNMGNSMAEKAQSPITVSNVFNVAGPLSQEALAQLQALTDRAKNDLIDMITGNHP